VIGNTGAASTVAGPIGPQGTQADGSAGAASTVAGPTGPTGLTGNTGPTGLTGNTGLTGANRPRGPPQSSTRPGQQRASREAARAVKSVASATLTTTGVYDVVITGHPEPLDVRRARGRLRRRRHGQRDAECHLGHVTVTTYGFTGSPPTWTSS